MSCHNASHVAAWIAVALQVSGVRAARAAAGDFERPRGIFVLDTAAGTPYNGETLRDRNIRDLPFVSGREASRFETAPSCWP